MKYSDEIKKRLLHKKLNYGLTSEDASELGINYETLRKMVYRYQMSQKNVTSPVLTPKQKSNDKHIFEDRLKALRKQWLSVMHLCDIHFPYHHRGAVDLSVQLVSHVQPDVCVLGSDEFDFMRLGKFDIDPRLQSDDLDEIDVVRTYHQNLVDSLMQASPKTIYVWIFGNHDYRLFNYILRQSPNLANTVTSAFTDMIRYQGRVLYMGETDQIRINNLIVAHGSRAGIHPAKAHYDITGGQAHYMAGHVHRRSFYQKEGYFYNASSVTSGCLCQLQPHYKSFRQDKTTWELGTCIADLQMSNNGIVNFSNLKFDETENGSQLETRFERRLFFVDA